MRVSPQGRAVLKVEEGTVLRTYRCPAGVLTIGTGHTAAAGGLKPLPGMTITAAQADELLRSDLRKFEARVDRTGAFTAQHAYDGATSFDFNTGRIHNASWVKLYRAGKRISARKSFMQWRKPACIIGRRTRECAMVFDGVYPHHKAQPKASAGEKIKECKRLMRKLGLFNGTVDSTLTNDTRAAVLAFQQKHPHLTNDGVPGRATLASLQRATNARARAKQVATSAAAAATPTAAAAEAPQAVDASIGLLGAGACVLVAVGAVILLWRYRDEIRHALRGL